MWNYNFKSSSETDIPTHIPDKTCKAKGNLPWISPRLKKLIRKRDMLYKRKKKSDNAQESVRFKEVWHLCKNNSGVRIGNI